MISWPKQICSVKCTNKQASSVQAAFKESRVVTQGPSHAPRPEAPLLLATKRRFS